MIKIYAYTAGISPRLRGFGAASGSRYCSGCGPTLPSTFVHPSGDMCRQPSKIVHWRANLDSQAMRVLPLYTGKAVSRRAHTSSAERPIAGSAALVCAQRNQRIFTMPAVIRPAGSNFSSPDE
ncbi:hypothetical protein KCP76_21065 [Salmonella enterica subsp. enterica serovar Weltevreden]|nr:hypothetical protein KCP76_21065 [Salmonella enterica subsp. enterica serovar Weltevreden]